MNPIFRPKPPLHPKPLSGAEQISMIDSAANYSILMEVINNAKHGHYNTKLRNMIILVLRTLKQHDLADLFLALPPKEFDGPTLNWQVMALQRYLEREIERINHLRQTKPAVGRNGSNN